MLYKEWRLVRLKMLMLAGIYIAIGLVVYVIQPNVVIRYNDPPMLSYWFIFSVLATLGAAVFCGVDIIADEKSSGTLGFLLARPISRTRIYMTKILLNLGGLAVVFLVSSAIMFIINTIPRNVTLVEYRLIDGVIKTTPPVQIFASTVGFEEALTKTFWILMQGSCFICISGIISIFTRSMLESLSLNIVAAIIFGFILGMINTAPFQLDAGHRTELIAIASLAVLTVGVFTSGLFIFQRKEF